VVVLVEGRIVADDSVSGLLGQMPESITTLQSAYGKLVGVAV
jgi:hypothetical protein